MANFSSGAMYVAIVLFYGWLVAFPANFLLWAGLAISMKKEDGKMNYLILKKRLLTIALPISAIGFAFWSLLNIFAAISVGGFVAFLAASLIAAMPTIGFVYMMLLVAKFLDYHDRLTKGAWSSMVFGGMVVMAIIVYNLIMLVTFLY
jgi:hypothetical protein